MTEIALPITVCCILAFLPGVLLFRGLGKSWPDSVACAPVYAFASYGAIAVAYGIAGIPCSWATVFLPPLLVGVVVFAASVLLARRGAKGSGKSLASAQAPGREGAEHAAPDVHAPDAGRAESAVHAHATMPREGLCLAFYMAFGLLATMLMFLWNLHDASSFNQYYDNFFHIEKIRTFANSTDWSSIGTSLYGASEVSPYKAPGAGIFYPSAYHSVGAMVVALTGCNAAVAENAVNATMIAFVLPAGMFALMRLLFAKRPAAVWLGALVVLGSGAFPWRIVSFGPLFPNVASMAMAPSVAFFFISIFADGSPVKARVVNAAGFVLGAVAVAITQPNSVFLLGVFLAPFCVYKVFSASGRLKLEGAAKTVVRLALSALTIVAVCAVWYAFYKAPSLQAVVTYPWEPYTNSAFVAFKDAVLFRFFSLPKELWATGLVLLAVVYCLIHREHLWLCFPLAFFAVAYMAVGAFDGEIRHLLGGFWYTDKYRIAACMVFCAIPLMALGAYFLCLLAAKLIAFIAGKAGGGKAQGPDRFIRPAGAVIGACLCAWIYGPALLMHFGVMLESSLSVVSVYLQSDYMTPEAPTYNADEIDFAKRVKEIAGDDLVVNIPDDGSAFAYAVEGVNAYYRYIDWYGDSETEDSFAIRGNLNEISENEKVRDAVLNTGAKYVMMLDADAADLSGYYMGDGLRMNFPGVYKISEDTPGFELVLSEGDMRLYRILPS